MNLKYRTALIGFCPDLTDPHAPSIPVAALLVGEAEGQRLGAAVVVIPDKHLGLDDLSRAMLADVPALLRRHVGEVIETLPLSAPLETILYSFHDGLRNSLHVVEISDETAFEVEVNELTFLNSIHRRVLDLGFGVLRNALETRGFHLILWPDPDPAVQRKPVSAEKTVHAMPHTSVWPLIEDRYAFA